MKWASESEVFKIIQCHRKGMTTPEIVADLGLPVDKKNIAWVKGQIHRLMGSVLKPKRITIKQINVKFSENPWVHTDGPAEKILLEEAHGHVSGAVDHYLKGKRTPAKGSKKGCRPGYTRYTVILREETVDRLNRVATKSGDISKIADAALTEYLNKFNTRS